MRSWGLKGVDNPRSRLTDVDVVGIREKAAAGISCRELSKEYNTGIKNVEQIVRGKTWRHVAFPSVSLPPMVPSVLDPRLYITESGEVFRKDGKRVKAATDRNGYVMVSIMENGVVARYPAHRLVASTYCDGYKTGLVVNHKDSNPSNNHYSNLEWVTQKENVKHAFDVGRQRLGEKHQNAKLTDADVSEIRRLLDAGEKGNRIAGRFGVTASHISQIKKGRQRVRMRAVSNTEEKR